MPVLVGDTFFNCTVETIKHHLILRSNYKKSILQYTIVKVILVPKVELDPLGLVEGFTECFC